MAGKINLFKGHATSRLLPSHKVLEAAKQLLTPETRPGDDDDEDRHPLIYGPDEGALSARREFAVWSNSVLGGNARAEHLCLTNGASYGAASALLLCTSAHTGYTRRAFVVSPTYFLINSVFLDAGFAGKLTAVREGPGGVLDLEYLEQQLQHYDATSPDVSLDDVRKVVGDPSKEPDQKFYRYVMYLVPTFSNPRGGVLPLAQRHRLIQLARKHDVLLLCDDVYDALAYDQDPKDLPPRLVQLDRDTLEPGAKWGNTVSNCTVSKLIGPGLRVGWQETATPALAAQLADGGAIRSGGTPAHLNTLVVRELLRRGDMEPVIAELREVFGARSHAARRALEQHLPAGTQIEGGGGYFFWVTLPPGYDSATIAAQCADRGVILAPGSEFEVAGDPQGYDRAFRVCFAYHEQADIVRGIEIWGSVCSATRQAIQP